MLLSILEVALEVRSPYPTLLFDLGCWVVTEQKTHLSGHVPRDFGDLLDKVSLN